MNPKKQTDSQSDPKNSSMPKSQQHIQRKQSDGLQMERDDMKQSDLKGGKSGAV